MNLPLSQLIFLMTKPSHTYYRKSDKGLWGRFCSPSFHVLLTIACGRTDKCDCDGIWLRTVVTSELKILVPLRSPSCTLPLMLSSMNVGTLSFLSMTHTSIVKLWRCTDVLKDTCSTHTHKHILYINLMIRIGKNIQNLIIFFVIHVKFMVFIYPKWNYLWLLFMKMP